MKENQTFPELISGISSPPSTDGMLRTSSFTDSELLSVVTDPVDSALPMTTNNTWLSTSQTSDSDNWAFFPREIQRESLRNNSKEKLKNPEVPKRLKFWLPEKSKPKPMSERPRNNTSRKSSHDLYIQSILLPFYSIRNFIHWISLFFRLIFIIFIWFAFWLN